MKTNFLAKHKWWALAVLLMVALMAVSISYSTWDTLSLKAKLVNGKSGGYKDYVKLLEDKFLPNNAVGKNALADVGDIVTFGNYYQQANTSTKSPIRWIVVEKDGAKLTLLAEKVMAFGSFWGNVYYDDEDRELMGTQAYGSFYQNYSKSTVRAWLNSANTRNDGGPTISSASSQGVQFKGFMSEAFTKDEQDYIIPKTMSGMKGAGIDNNPTTQTYDAVTDKVWLPSYIEMYSNTGITWGVGSDNLSDKQFSYFAVNDNIKKNGYTTAFASSQYSNYTWIGATSAKNYQSTLAGDNVWWWLRSPYPSLNVSPLLVYYEGSYGRRNSCASEGGVRPAVCVKI